MSLIFKSITALALLVGVLTSNLSAAHGDAASDDKKKPAAVRSATADVLYGAPLPISSWNAPPDPSDQEVVGTRSVPLAFGLSAVIPGLGQAYNKDWVAAAIFVAAEAVLIGLSVSWRNSGNEGVEEYEGFADDNWSPNKYALWLNDYSGYTGPDLELTSLTDEDFMDPDSWTAAQQAEVDAFFDDINRAERNSIYLETGATFSHVLPEHGSQQYYELIGKYFQYAPAWSDYEGDADENPREVMPEDAQFYTYSDDHAAANDDLRQASLAGALIIVNHFAAGVQAAVNARMHNRRIQPSVSLAQDPSGELITQARLRVTF